MNPTTNSSINSASPFDQISGSGVSSSTNQSVKINRLGANDSFDTFANNVNSLFRGEIVNIDRGHNKISVRNPQTGTISSYVISDMSLLRNLNQGDKVQIFSQ